MESAESKKGELHFDGCQIEYEDGKSDFASYRILEEAPGLPDNYFAVTPCLQFGKLNNKTMSIKVMTLKTLCIARNNKVCTVLLKKSANGKWQEQKDIPVVNLPNRPNGNIILSPPTPLQVGSRKSFVFVIPEDHLDKVKFGISGMLYAKGSLTDGNFVAKFYLRHTEYTHCQKDVDQTEDTPILHIGPLYLKRKSRVEVTLGSEDTNESQRNPHTKKSKVTHESKATVDVSQIFENGYMISNFALKERSSRICLYIHESAENIHLLRQVNFNTPAITDNSMVKKRPQNDEPREKQPEIEVDGVKYKLLRSNDLYVEPSLIEKVTAITKSQQTIKKANELYEGYMDDMVRCKVHVKLVKPEKTKIQIGMPVHKNVLKITAANTLPTNDNIGFIAMEHLGKGFKLLSKYITSNSDGPSISNDSSGSVISNKLDLNERTKIILQIIQAFSHLGWGKNGYVDVRLSKIYYGKGQVKLLPPQASKTVEETDIEKNLTELKTTCEQVIQIANQPNSKQTGFCHLFGTITTDASLLPSCVSEHFFFFNTSKQWQFIQNAYRQFQPYNEFLSWNSEICMQVLGTSDWTKMFKKEKDGILYYTANNTNGNVGSVYIGKSGKSLLCFYRNVFTHHGDKKIFDIPELRDKDVCDWYGELGVDNDDKLLLRLSNKFPNFLGYIYDIYHK
uniref:uncharacterized protein LOC120326395 n=1 Tax=Styela clava TaxID=7725 RepID=UPI001939E632|nr:uncharacterized protein LOC120326395 [Styela clava]